MEAIIRINIDNEMNEPEKPYTATVSVETGANWSLADERTYKLVGTSNADLLKKMRDMLAGRAAEALTEDLTYDLMWMDDKAWNNGEPVANYTAEKPVV